MLCFVDIRKLKQGNHFINKYAIEDDNSYAVVRKFKSPPVPIPGSNFVLLGELSESLYVFDCDTIESEIAVVHNPNSKSNSDNNFFVIKNRINNSYMDIFIFHRYK